MNKKVVIVLALLVLIAGGATFYFVLKENGKAIDNEKVVEQSNEGVEDSENTQEPEVAENNNEVEKEGSGIKNEYEEARQEAIKGHEMSEKEMKAVAEKAFNVILEGYNNKSFVGDADKIYNHFAPYTMFSEKSMRNIIANQFLLANQADSHIDFEYKLASLVQENKNTITVYYLITKDELYNDSGEFIDNLGVAHVQMTLEVDGENFKFVYMSFSA